MKIWKLTLRRSSGVNNTLRQNLSIQSSTSDNLWENETLQLKPGDRQRGSTKINFDTLTFDFCLFPASSSVSPWSPTTSYSTRIPELSSPICTKNISSGADGGWWKWQNEFWQNLQLTQYMLEMKWSPHAGSHFSQTLHGIATLDYQLVDLHTLLIFYSLILIWWNCLPAMTSAWYFKEPLRNETEKFLILKLCFPWLVYILTPSIFFHYYLSSSNLPFNTETTKKFPAEKKPTENLRTSSVTWQSTLGEFVNSHQRA